MKFCEKCGNLLTPKKENDVVVWYCDSCDITYENDVAHAKLSQKQNNDDKGIIMVEENKASLPITDKECPKCGNNKAYWWTLQTRSSDEPETRFYRCTKCSYTWREYS